MPKVLEISLHIFEKYISRKAWGMKLIFCLQINKSFLQVDNIILGVRSQACPKYPKQQFTMSLQYLKEKVKGEVDFLPVDKRQRFLQSDTITLGVCSQTWPNYAK